MFSRHFLRIVDLSELITSLAQTMTAGGMTTTITGLSMMEIFLVFLSFFDHSLSEVNNLDQVRLEKNRDKIKKPPHTDNVGTATMFLVVLEGMVYTVGAIFAAAGLYLAVRYYNGQSLPCLNVFDAELSARVSEFTPHSRFKLIEYSIGS